MYQDFFTENGIPQNLTTSMTVLFFLLAVSSLFPGARIFGVEFPKLTNLGRTLATIVGGVGLLLMIIGFQPIWQNEKAAQDQLPYCYIETTREDASGIFEIRWFVQADGEFWSTLEANGYFVSSKASGATKANLQELVEPLVYVLTAGNRYGVCSRTVTIRSPHTKDKEFPNCSITVSKPKAKVGEDFTVQWSVSGPSGTMAYINGSKVELIGQKTFEFSGENYSRFHLIANFDGYTCEDHSRIISE